MTNSQREELLPEGVQGIPISDRGYFYEDELPKNYPYDAMFPYSWVDGVRLFPMNIPWEVYQSETKAKLAEVLSEIEEANYDPRDDDLDITTIKVYAKIAEIRKREGI